MKEYWDFDPKILSEELNKLHARNRAAFCAACCERMFPNYCEFRQIDYDGNCSFLRRCLDLIWDYSLGRIDREELIQFTKAAEDNPEFPDEDDVASVWGTLALYACSAVHKTFLAVENTGALSFANAVYDAVESVYIYAQEVHDFADEDQDFIKRVMLHPVVRSEFKYQEDDINCLFAIEESKMEEFRSKYIGWPKKFHHKTNT